MPCRRFELGVALPALGLLLLGGTVLAAPSLEDYAALPAVQMMSVSPDGKLVAFRLRKTDNDGVLVYALEENRIVTGVNVSAIRPTHLYFLNQSYLILVATADDFMRGYRGHHRISTAFAMNVGSSTVDQLLTPGRGIIHGQLGLGNVIGASADGKRVYMPAFTPRKDRKPDYSLMEVDLDAVRKLRVLKKGSENTVDYFVDESGKVLVEERFSHNANHHRIISYLSGQPVEIYQARTEIPLISAVALSADRKFLVFAAESEEHDRLGYYAMSLTDGSFSSRVFERSDADVESILMDVNRIAYGVVYSGLKPSYEFFDERLTRNMAEIQAHFPTDAVWVVDASPDLNHLVIQVEGTGSSGDYYLFSEGNLRFLTSSRPEIPSEHVNPVILFEYGARDGATIPALVTVPKAHGEGSRDLPAVMLPHGGPEAHDWVGFDWLAQALASQGYVVIQPQFRGSSGFGVQHLLAGRGEWGRKSQEDITDALRHLIAEGLVDADRVCIAGVSYGGFAALAGGAFTPELYKCIVSVNGVSDVRKILAQEKRDHGRSHAAVAYWNEVIARGDTGKATLETISPANFAAEFRAPVLLVHGDKDNVVDFEQSRHMEKQLKRADKPVKLLKLKNEDHHLSNPKTRVECLKAVVEFVNAQIGTRT